MYISPLRQQLYKTTKEIQSKSQHIYPKEILKNIHITQKKAGKRKQNNEKQKKQNK